MKKTININLGGTFFHIDEDAFEKLNRYLDAIKSSFSDPMGQDEIIRDIEARISELFSEKVQSATQVITMKELDEVIEVMGQPEDYMVDEEIFDDAPRSSQKSRTYNRANYKQLFRDVDNKFVSGVAAGLGHYLGIDTIWVRLLWILLTVFSSGFFLVVYILFWILVPAAESTADKLKMQGDAINIENIEKKIKDEYERVASKVKDVDFEEYKQQAKAKGGGFFEAIGSVLGVFFKVLFKFIGIILIIAALSTLVSLIIGTFSFGSLGFWSNGWMDYVHVYNTTGAPIWFISLLTLLSVGIPFFVLFILGLKILIPNLKSIGAPLKIILGVFWIGSLIALGIIGIQQFTEASNEGSFTETHELPIQANDTLRLNMASNTQYEYRVYRGDGLEIRYNEDDERVLYGNDIRLIVRSTSDNTAKLSIEKTANALEMQRARQLAKNINYNYTFSNNTLSLNGYFLCDMEDQYHNQEIEIILYLPVGTILYADDNTRSFHSNSSYYDDILNRGDEEEYLRIERNRTVCLSCPDGRDTNYSESDDYYYSSDDSDDWDNRSWKDDEGWIDEKDNRTNNNNQNNNSQRQDTTQVDSLQQLQTTQDSIPGGTSSNQ